MAYINGKKILFSSKVNITEGATLMEKSITANGTYNATSDDADGYSSVIVNVPSSSGGSGIIEVYELPEFGEDGAIYKLGKDSFGSVLANVDGLIYPDVIVAVTGCSSKGNYYVKTKPTEDVMASTDDGDLYLYYVEDENDIFLYQETDDGGEWITFAELLGAEDVSFGGVITDEAQATEEGYYVFGKSKIFQYYQYNASNEFIDVVADGFAFSEYIQLGLVVGFYENKIKPVENIKVTDLISSNKLYFYYITSENDIFLYQETDDGGEWITFAELLGAEDVSFGGVITDEAQATEGDVYYALKLLPHYNKLIFEKDIPVITSEEQTVTPTKSTQTITPDGADYLSKVTVNPIPDKYITPSGTINLDKSGTYDVKQYSSAVVDINPATVYTVQTKAELPADATIGSFAFVLGGE